MKKLLLLSLFIFPAVIVSFAQRFDVSEQAGMSFTNNTLQKDGFANQVAVGYRLKKHLSLSAFYERNNWASANNSFGLAFDFTSRYFFAGIEAKYASLSPYTDVWDYWEDYKYTYSRAFGCGIHIGAKQKIYKRFCLVEQAGYVLEQLTYSVGFPGGTILNGVFSGISIEYRLPEQMAGYAYARIGISYKL